MTNAQLYLVVGVPILANAVMFGLVWAFLRAKFEEIDRHFDAMDRHFHDMRAL